MRHRRHFHFPLTAEIVFNVALAALLAAALAFSFFRLLPGGSRALVVLTIVGLLPVARSALTALWRRELTIDLLAGIALVASLIAAEWFSAAFITLMLAFARIFALWTEARAKDVVSHLARYRPVTVKLKRGDEIVEVPVGEVRPGDLAVIEAGERVPVDGVVVSGQASLNEATLTGESEPTTKRVGDSVLTATLNESGSLLVRVDRVGKESTLEKLISLVAEASRKKSHIETIASRFTAWYIAATLLGSLALYVFIGRPQLVLAVLLVVCADDIAVAVPLSFTAAIARAARRGLLVKGAPVFEVLPTIKTFLTDKTGTLTTGKPRVRRVVAFGHATEAELLRLLGIAEAESRHPISTAVMAYLAARGVHAPAPDDVDERPGEGIVARHGGEEIIAGKIHFLEARGVRLTERERAAFETAKAAGFGITAVARATTFVGYIEVEDAIRPAAHQVVARTRALGVRRWIMLTGDNEVVAARVASELQLDGYEANLTPQAKLDAIERIKRSDGGTLAMIGDGVNDAAALALADVSFAMGAVGSDTAIEAADVALIHDSLNRIPEAMVLGRKTMTIVRQIFALWALTNAVGLALVFAGVLTPVGAAAYNFLTDFLPIANALRVGMAKAQSPHA